MPLENSSCSAERDYFDENPAPVGLQAYKSLAQDFINLHKSAGRRVVLVTSGGTTVPLEKQTVRFIDNFSAGTRGATSAEYFLDNGYAVIFLHRQFSLLPYSRHYSHTTDCFLDFLHEGQDGNVVANEECLGKMIGVLRKYNCVKARKLLVKFPFTTVTEYLFMLRMISQLMRPLGSSGLLYLAAAVSDFFVPLERMSEHKIQSTNAADPKYVYGTKVGKFSDEAESRDDSSQSPQSKHLVINLDPIPKFLKNLVDGWAPECMIVSFKLETDPDILVHKSQYSLTRYQHHLVIGNLLATRKFEVVFVAPGQAPKWIRTTGDEENSATENNAGCVTEGFEREMDTEIESLIVPAVKELHSKHINRFSTSSAQS
ncbi:Bgt-3294 [Blumeria graminis f. sp. tritici]|uniref:Bgt-3294 n=2 Tax=Blumeria graminis f. sp. tritici TaxID=62690 RepID=A0A061HDK3_BLUGR|nr:hypothetical protein BGT96224_3294 [Blumeria graminis f. sp. tritici 96224]VCU39409.1 Bgt-3294 [Blumeria graminis f. sp. tritici]